MTVFQQQLQRDAAACDAVLQQLIAETKGPANRLLEAMQYAVFNGGKRMRAALVLGASRMALGAGDAAVATKGTLRTAAAIECLHAYSLVHDDLPSMDNDNLRRGLPTTHKKFSESTAILAADALRVVLLSALLAELLAALLADLKQQGMLDETLVVWGGEFGRQPTAEYAKGTGRDHNSYGFTMWMAGGGVKGGLRFGATDDYGYYADYVTTTSRGVVWLSMLWCYGDDYDC